MEPKQETMEEKLARLIHELVFAVTDGGQNIEPSRFLSYQEEPVHEFEKIQKFIREEITHAIEAHDKMLAEKVKKVSWETNDLPGGKLVTLDEVLSLINKQI